MSDSVFNGFNNKTFRFLSGIAKNNNKAFFDANRNIYDNDLVAPARALVTELSEFLLQLQPDLRTEPKFNVTLMRLNNDLRFSKGDPYKTYFLIHFGRFKMDSEFYIYLDKNGVSIGIFINQSKGENFFFRQNLTDYREEFTGICNKNKINGKYTLSKIAKVPEVLAAKFNAAKHADIMTRHQYILLEKQYPLKHKICTSSALLTEAVKMFSQLYPVYCFSISTDPVRKIEQFENTLGVPT